MVSSNKALLSALLSLTLLAPASSALAQSAPLFTKGHADIVVEYDAEADAFEYVWLFEGATVGGKVLGEDHHDEDDGPVTLSEDHEGVEVPLDQAILATSATLTRPSASVYDALGVSAGESVFYLPQSDLRADELGTPFVGWEFAAPAGVFVNDTAQLRLISATRSGGQSIDFALWDGNQLPPTFAMASFDGLSSSDVLTIADHAHYEVTFGPADQPGDLLLQFEVSAQKVSGGTLTDRFVLQAKTCEGRCEGPVRPAPALGGLGTLALALGLGGAAFVGRRRKEGGARLA